MKVKIIKCKVPTSWYTNLIGQIYEVKGYDEHEEYYEHIDSPIYLILKADCEIIPEDLPTSLVISQVTSFAEWIASERLLKSDEGWFKLEHNQIKVVAKNTDDLLDLFLTTIKTT